MRATGSRRMPPECGIGHGMFIPAGGLRENFNIRNIIPAALYRVPLMKGTVSEQDSQEDIHICSGSISMWISVSDSGAGMTGSLDMPVLYAELLKTVERNSSYFRLM